MQQLEVFKFFGVVRITSSKLKSRKKKNYLQTSRFRTNHRLRNEVARKRWKYVEVFELPNSIKKTSFEIKFCKKIEIFRNIQIFDVSFRSEILQKMSLEWRYSYLKRNPAENDNRISWSLIMDITRIASSEWNRLAYLTTSKFWMSSESRLLKRSLIQENGLFESPQSPGRR